MSKQLIECAKCGHGNELTSVFCRDCGAKLDHSRLKADDVKKKAKAGAKKERGGGGAGGKAIKALLTLVGLALIGLAVVLWWPVEPIGEVGDPAMAKEVEEKLVRLKDAIENKVEFKTVLAEGEINAYLAELVADKGGLSNDGPSLENVNFLVETSHVEVYVQIKVGPMPMAYIVRGVPRVGSGPFTFEVKDAKIGMVPVPEGMQDKFVVAKVSKIFSELDDMRFILDRLYKLEPTQARIRLTTKGQ